VSDAEGDNSASTVSAPKSSWSSPETWSLLANVVTVFGLVFALAAAVFAWFEYSDRRNMAQDEQTIGLIDAWEERGYRVAYGHIRNVTRNFYSALPEADWRSVQTNQTARENMESRFYRGFFGEDANVKAFEQVRYFFNRLQLCLQAGLCSQELARTFFDDTAGTFLDCFGGYLDAEAALAGREDVLAKYRELFSQPKKLCMQHSFAK